MSWSVGGGDAAEGSVAGWLGDASELMLGADEAMSKGGVARVGARTERGEDEEGRTRTTASRSATTTTTVANEQCAVRARRDKYLTVVQEYP